MDKNRMVSILKKMYGDRKTYGGVAKDIGVERWDVYRVLVRGNDSPKVRRALALHTRESASWSSNRSRVYVDMGSKEAAERLRLRLGELGYDTASQFLRDLASE